MDKLTYIDIFAGCGGLSVGLMKAGLTGLFAVEKSEAAFSTLKYNLIDKCDHYQWPNWLEIKNWDIVELIEQNENHLQNLQGEVDLIVGGPPCQGFSLVGNRNEHDERNQLMYEYIKFVSLVKPKILMFENVLGFTVSYKNNEETNAQMRYSEVLIKKLKEIGYSDAIGHMIDFSEFGVPQKRTRFILIATTSGLAPEIFKRLESNKLGFLEKNSLSVITSVKDALSDLEKKNGTTQSPDTRGFLAGRLSEVESNYQAYLREESTEGSVPDSHRYVNHRDSTVQVFTNLLYNAPRNRVIAGDSRAEYGLKKRSVCVLDPKAPARTITTIPDDYIHYSEPRVLTVRECARLQSFPDWFAFKGRYTTGGKERVSTTPRYTQVGNAVPPLFAEQLGIAIAQIVGDY